MYYVIWYIEYPVGKVHIQAYRPPHFFVIKGLTLDINELCTSARQWISGMIFYKCLCLYLCVCAYACHVFKTIRIFQEGCNVWRHLQYKRILWNQQRYRHEICMCRKKSIQARLLYWTPRDLLAKAIYKSYKVKRINLLYLHDFSFIN